jgi:uncharacterized membrane protein/protein-disulfide isomerase
MQNAQRMHFARLFTLAALTGSLALAVKQWNPQSGSCGFYGDCDHVLHSQFSQGLGVPLPFLGVAAFATIFGISLFPARRTMPLLCLLTLAAGLMGLVLILSQMFVIRNLCPYCLFVDASALFAAFFAVGGNWREPFRSLSGRALCVWLGSAVAAVGVGATIGGVVSWKSPEQTPTAPPQVTRLWTAGKINIVEVADFECPHCRQMHAVLMQLLAEEGDNVRFVRLTAPMPSHPHSRHASRAFVCAQEQDRGEEMAEALFVAWDLTPDGCEQLATSIGLSQPAFRACVVAPDTDQRLNADVEWVKVASPRGLPVIWVQDRMLFGVQPIEALRDAVREAERQIQQHTPVADD